MIRYFVFMIGVSVLLPIAALGGPTEDANKLIAQRFYNDVWFSHNPATVDEIVAPTYVVHDIGDRKGVTETASDQKDIAEFFWQHGSMTGKIDYQIAEGDLVATAWQWDFKPSVWWMKALGGRNPIPIVNVFRIQDGKIVEIWNYRHDIDTGVANIKLIAGIVIGLIPSLILLAIVFVQRRRMRKLRNDVRATASAAA